MLELLKKFSVEVLAVLSLLSIAIIYKLMKNYLTLLIGELTKQLQEMNQKLDLSIIEQRSTDHALEKSFSNGFSKYKAEKKKELIEDYKFKKVRGDTWANLLDTLKEE